MIPSCGFGVEALRQLLEGTRVGVLTHVDASGAVQAFPVAFRWHAGRFRVGVPSGALPSGARVALAVDDGWFWWELRAVLARGVLTPVGAAGRLRVRRPSPGSS